ncbi:hypothetical protein GGR52DRAFT_549301 [Hypoxylon sp. FL1284]|nr:hypothetical protein GGR52DRAFT_549301 [Hypoxylon sp. FL1284]
MCRDCYHMTAATLSSSVAITNPELVLPYYQEQKQRAAASRTSQTRPQPQTESYIKPSSASTYSGSTVYSYDKEQDPVQTKEKRSMRQRLKDALRDADHSHTSKEARRHD